MLYDESFPKRFDSTLSEISQTSSGEDVEGSMKTKTLTRSDNDIFPAVSVIYVDEELSAVPVQKSSACTLTKVLSLGMLLPVAAFVILYLTSSDSQDGASDGSATEKEPEDSEAVGTLPDERPSKIEPEPEVSPAEETTKTSDNPRSDEAILASKTDEAIARALKKISTSEFKVYALATSGAETHKVTNARLLKVLNLERIGEISLESENEKAYITCKWTGLELLTEQVEERWVSDPKCQTEELEFKMRLIVPKRGSGHISVKEIQHPVAETAVCTGFENDDTGATDAFLRQLMNAYMKRFLDLYLKPKLNLAFIEIDSGPPA